VRLALDAAMEQPEGEIFIIPVRLEECDTLESLRKWQWVDLFEEAGYRRLMLAFNEKARRVDASFTLQEQHSIATSSDKSFLNRVVEELEKEEEIPSWEFSLSQSFPAPGSKAEGITWDGMSLWLSDNSGTIFKMSPSGKVLDSVRSPDVTPQGLTWDGSSFWVYTTNHSFIYQIRIAGENVQTISSFRSPAQVLGGGITQDMAWDGENLLFANQFKVYRLDGSGKVLGSFTFHKNVTGLGWDGSNLWIAYNNFPEKASLSRVDMHGESLETYVSPILEINGLAWADDYLWALGSDAVGGKPMIYKLSLPAR
jgi:hypothetical protein